MTKARNANLERPSGTVRSDARPDHDRIIQRLVAESLEHKSRECVAQQMTASLHGEIEITRSMLDNFAAGNKVTARFPASFVSAFCEATGDDRLRLHVIGPRLRSLVEFAEKMMAAARNRRELRRLIEFTRKSLAAGEDRRELRQLLEELLGDEGPR
jgi:hypothetical protein